MNSYNFNVSVAFVMPNKQEQRVCIKFCVKLEKSVTETFEMIKKVFDDEVMNRFKTFKLDNIFCHKTITNNSRTGRS